MAQNILPGILPQSGKDHINIILLSLDHSHLHVSITAHPEASLEQLDANDCEHEEEEDGDEEDVADVLHSHDDALHHVLQTLGSVDGSAKVKCVATSKNGDCEYNYKTVDG